MSGPLFLHSHSGPLTREAFSLAAPLLAPDAAFVEQSPDLPFHSQPHPDLILLGLDRFGEPAKALLRSARALGAPVVALFERASSEELDLFCRLGARVALSLPADPSLLSAAISRCLEPESCPLPSEPADARPHPPHAPSPAEPLSLSLEIQRRDALFAKSLPGLIIDLAQDFASPEPEDIERAAAALASLADAAEIHGLLTLSQKALDLAKKAREASRDGLPPPSLQDALSLLAHANIDPIPSAAGPHRGEPIVCSIPERTVFLADSDPQRSARICDSLQRMGYPSRSFPSLVSAAQAASLAPPVAVIVDESLCSNCADPRLTPLVPLPKILIGSSDDFSSLLKAASVGAISCVPPGTDSASIAGLLDTIFRECSSDPFDILLVEGDPASENRLRSIIELAGMSCRIARSGPEAIEALRETVPDAVLVDLLLPDCPGGLLARIIRLKPEWISLPILFLASAGETALARSALSQDGDGVLDESSRDEDIAEHIRRAACRSREVSSAMAKDGLTGLLRHTHAADAVRRAFSEARRSGSPCSVAMIDVDRFKSVNDRFGHAIGDHVLRGLASIISRSLRGADLAGRFGGEEFLILLPDCSADDALAKADSLRQAFRSLSFSAGVASSDGFSSHEDMLLAADEALYRAKRAGRDRVFISDRDEAP